MLLGILVLLAARHVTCARGGAKSTAAQLGARTQAQGREGSRIYRDGEDRMSPVTGGGRQTQI